jgi:hypothetical protein
MSESALRHARDCWLIAKGRLGRSAIDGKGNIQSIFLFLVRVLNQRCDSRVAMFLEQLHYFELPINRGDDSQRLPGQKPLATPQTTSPFEGMRVIEPRDITLTTCF